MSDRRIGQLGIAISVVGLGLQILFPTASFGWGCVAVGVFMLCGVGLAHWLDKRALSRARLSVEINDALLAIGSIETPQKITVEGAFIVVRATVRNAGQPVAVEAFRLSAIGPDGVSWFGESQQIPDEFVLPSTGSEVFIHAVDQLSAKTLTPIPTGGFVRGWMVYFFAGLDERSLGLTGTMIRFEMRDTLLRELSAEKPIARLVRSGGPLTNYPGMMPTVRPPQP